MPSDFTSLNVWKESIHFCKNIYEIVKNFPIFEERNIVSQLRRASASISTNIAEGCGKTGFRDEMSFFRIAQGSAKECMSLILLSKELGYLNNDKCFELFDQGEKISKMLTLLIRDKKEKYIQFREGYKLDFDNKKI